METRPQILTAGVGVQPVQRMLKLLQSSPGAPLIRQVDSIQAAMTVEALLASESTAVPHTEGLYQPGRPVILMAYMQQHQYAAVMDFFREQLKERPVFGGLTETNRRWPFEVLAEELIAEAAAFAEKAARVAVRRQPGEQT